MTEIGALPLNPSVRNKLQCAGFITTDQLDGMGPVELSRGAWPPSIHSAWARQPAVFHSPVAPLPASRPSIFHHQMPS